MQQAANMPPTTDATFSSHRPGSHRNPTQLTRAATTLRFLRRNRRGLRPVGTGTGTYRVPARLRPARASRLSPDAKVFVPLACRLQAPADHSLPAAPDAKVFIPLACRLQAPADHSVPAAPAALTAALPGTKKTQDGPMHSPKRDAPALSRGPKHPPKNGAPSLSRNTTAGADR